MEPNANLSPQVTHQPSLLGGAENMKLLFDDTMSFLSMARQENFANSRAWEALKLRQANQAASFDHLVNMTAAAAGQTGDTEDQSSVTPIRTAAADTEVQQPAGSVYPPIRNVDQSGSTAIAAAQTAQAAVSTAAAGVATANQSVADAVANLMNTLTAVITAAAGNASGTAAAAPAKS